jgi:hypothetical protein
MGYDYSKKLKAEGQQHSNACWAASISWWTGAMALNNKRVWLNQTNLLADYAEIATNFGSLGLKAIKKVCQAATVRIDLKFLPPTALTTNYTFDSPAIIIFNYPVAGGTHMNVIFNQVGNTVMCMEPFYPLKANEMGERKGTYVRRPLSFFANSEEVGVGCLPLSDALLELNK